MAAMRVFANAVLPGDFLPNLGNGYVTETESADSLFVFNGYVHSALPDEMTAITFHDANGDENYLILVNEHYIDIERS